MNQAEYIKLLKSFILKKVKSSAVTYIISKVPFMSWGPFAYLLNFFLEKALHIFLTQTELAIFIMYVDTRVDSEGRAYTKSIEKYLSLQDGGSLEEKEAIERELVNSFRRFVKF